MNFSFKANDIKDWDQKEKDMVGKEICKIFNNHQDEINNSEFDSCLEEMFITGWKHFVEFALDVLNRASVKVINPLYQIIDGKLYKRLEK